MKKMAIEDKLALDIFHTDDNNSHIDVDVECQDEALVRKVVLACPAHCYTYNGDTVTFSHLGCLECGTCRVLAHDRLVQSWKHPDGGVGVFYKEG